MDVYAIAVRESATIDHHIVLYGLPIPGRARIEVWEPGRRFVDRQIAGPYRWWLIAASRPAGVQA